MSQATCKPFFSEYGWLDTLVSDNGPHSAVIEFGQAMMTGMSTTL